MQKRAVRIGLVRGMHRNRDERAVGREDRLMAPPAGEQNAALERLFPEVLRLCKLPVVQVHVAMGRRDVRLPAGAE